LPALRRHNGSRAVIGIDRRAGRRRNPRADQRPDDQRDGENRRAYLQESNERFHGMTCLAARGRFTRASL
jgi:hypothetical protein